MNQSDAKELRLLGFLFMIAILTYIPTGIGTAHATSIKNIQIFQGTYDAGSDEQDFLLPEGAVDDINKTFIIISFNHTTASDQENVYRSWNFTNSSAIRMYGGSAVPADNDELKFVAYVVETFDGSIQHLLFNLSASQPAGEFELPLDNTVNASASFIVLAGQDHDAVEGSWGSEELARVRLINSTHWGYQVGVNPNTEPTNIRVSVIEDSAGITRVQNGTAQLNGTTPTLTFLPPVNVTTDTSLILCSYYIMNGEGFNERPRDTTMTCELDPLETNATITATTSSTDSALDINFHWQLITDSFGNELTIEHGSEVISGGTAQVSETITEVNATNTIAMTGLQTPFGQGWAQSDAPASGNYDRSAFTLRFVTNTTLLLERADSGNTGFVSWQVLEFLEVGVDPQKFANQTDTATVTDQVQLTITKSVVDIATAVDVSTEFNVTKQLIDTATLADQVNATALGAEQVNQTDTATVSDQVQLNITKALQDIATGTDQVNLIINKTLADIATVLDTVDTVAMIELELNDTATVTDEVDLIINKTLADIATVLDTVETTLTIEVNQTDTATVTDEVDLIINKTITDIATVLDTVETTVTFELNQNDTAIVTDQVQVIVTKAIQDIATATDNVDLIINKTLIDIATVLDTVETTVTLELNQNDTATVLDEVQLNITKALQDTATTTDQVNLIINKTVTDIATILDTVETIAIIQLNQNDTATVLDEVQLNITKALQDTATTTDQVNLIIDKTITDIATVVDIVNVTTTFDVMAMNDTATVLDEVQLNTTKTLQDIATATDQVNLIINKTLTDLSVVVDTVETILSVVQELNDTATVTDQVNLTINKTVIDSTTVIDVGTRLNITKVIADVTLVADQVQLQVIAEVTQTDIATILDQVELEIFKGIQDGVIVVDQVDITNIIQINITDIAIVSDTVTLTVSGAPSVPITGGGGGGLPSESFQRLIGLNIMSEVISVGLNDEVPTEFEIEVFGQQFEDTFITDIEPDPDFSTWFEFTIPDELEFMISIDTERTINDPRRVSNIALNDYLVLAPPIPCSQIDPFEPVPDVPVPCLEPILYQIPVEFEFKKGSSIFHEDHIVIVDARIPVAECVVFGFVVPVIVCLIIENILWIIVTVGIFFIFVLLARRRKDRLRIVRRIKRGELTSMAERDVKRKFKRGRR